MSRKTGVAMGAVCAREKRKVKPQENMEMHGIIVKLLKYNYYHREFVFQRCAPKPTSTCVEIGAPRRV
jgi:hypothetical protein